MAERYEEVPLPLPMDPTEARIHEKFDQLIICLNRRREQLITEYRERQEERRAETASRNETLQQLIDTKAHIKTEMKENLLHSFREKMVGDIYGKMGELEVAEKEVEVLFECDTQQLEKTISRLGQMLEKGTVPIPESIALPQQVSETSLQTVGHVPKENWEILDRSALKLGRNLGTGQFSDVSEGIWNNNIKIAVKIMKPGTISKENFLAHTTIMKKLNHENILKLFTVCTREDLVYIVIEYMEKGDLLSFLRIGEGLEMKEPELVDIVTQVASGMAYLELHHYIHTNLAARNVLVSANNQIKVAGFVNIRDISDKGFYEVPPSWTIFPVKWTDPDALLNEVFTIKSDVWSFGILLMEAITRGGEPYQGMNIPEVLTKVSPPENYRMLKPPKCPDHLYQIMLDCWNVNPDARPSFENLEYQLKDFYVRPVKRYNYI